MKVELSFSELQEMVENKTGKKVLFSQVDGSTLNVAYPMSVHIPIIGNVTKTVSMKLNINMVSNTHLAVACDGDQAVNVMLMGALKFIEDDPKFKFVEIKENHRLILHLEQLEPLKDVFSKVDIQAIEVIEYGFNVTCKLKEIF